VSGAILAVDVGDVRIGLAISERPELPAMPLTTLAHESRARDVERIVDLAAQRAVTHIVVGYPLRLDGSPGPAAQKVDKFIDAMRARFAGQVIRVDERMTTAAAQAKLRSGELSPSRRRALVDRLAAVEILETYLARARQEG
jgi:putative holliday junction resolvase